MLREVHVDLIEKTPSSLARALPVSVVSTGYECSLALRSLISGCLVGPQKYFVLIRSPLCGAVRIQSPLDLRARVEV